MRACFLVDCTHVFCAYMCRSCGRLRCPFHLLPASGSTVAATAGPHLRMHIQHPYEDVYYYLLLVLLYDYVCVVSTWTHYQPPAPSGIHLTGGGHNNSARSDDVILLGTTLKCLSSVLIPLVLLHDWPCREAYPSPPPPMFEFTPLRCAHRREFHSSPRRTIQESS